MSGKDQSDNMEGLNPGAEAEWAHLDELLQNPTRYQEETLRQIVDDNANCEYLVRHGLMSGATKEAFKECIPIVDYADIEEYIERIADGDRSPILCNYPVRLFGLSSGTSSGGQLKKIPITNEYLKRLKAVSQYSRAIEKRTYPPSEYPGLYNGKILNISVVNEQAETKGGFQAGSISTSLVMTKDFQDKFLSYRFTSPLDVMLCADTQQGIYCHFLCGLLQASDVWAIRAGFAFIMANAYKNFQQFWPQLCQDIRNGTLNEMITDDKTRKAMLELLKPNPELADFVAKECSKSWEKIIKRLWPNTVYIQCIATGPVMKPYIATINYYSGNLPLVTKHYGATEGGNIALNMDIKRPLSEVVFTLMPETAFYEFIPLQVQEDEFMITRDKPQTVEFDGLRIGHHYDIVLTTFQGLYRYRLGDVLKFTGFDKECPMFQYVGRRNVLLAVGGEKTNEEELQQVIEKASSFLKEHGAELLDYTSCVDHSLSIGHYVLFFEVDFNSIPCSNEEDQVMQECCCLADSSFNFAYNSYRKSGMIGALEVRVLRRGTFQQIFNHFLKQGADMSQYKPPRCVASSPLQHILNNGVLRVYESTFSSWNA